MTELEIAQRFSDYDHDTTPTEKLGQAQLQVAYEEFSVSRGERRLDELDDTLIYEWCYSDDGEFFALVRQIAKRTKKQIRLHPRFAGDKQIILPREEIESGEIVRREFGFGWALRPTLLEQYNNSTRRLESKKSELRRIETAIANNRPVLNPHQQQMVEIIMAVKEREQAERDNNDWRQLGF